VCREVVWLTMDLTSHLSSSLSQCSSARAFLGSDHPLTRVLEWLGTLLAHSLLVGLLLSAAVAELVRGAPWALQVAVAAAIVEAALACVALLLGRYKRELVLDLIIGGRGDLPFVAVKRQRRRLLDPRTRAKLAARIEGVIKEARATARKPHLPRAAAPIHVAAASWPGWGIARDRWAPAENPPKTQAGWRSLSGFSWTEDRRSMAATSRRCAKR
jgi:hypothetical protein